MNNRDVMAIISARLLEDQQRVLVGVGTPNVAANLAKRLHAPNLVMIYESGIIDARPKKLPLSIGDGTLVEESLAVLPMGELFSQYLQTGWIDIGFLGAAQIDSRGNLNSTTIGSYEHPTIRLAGSGGAADIAHHARRTITILPHSRERFAAKIDFVTSPGHPPGGCRPDGGGPWRVVTDLGLFGFDSEGEMICLSLMPSHTYEEILDMSGWHIPFQSPLSVVPDPSSEEIRVLQSLYDTLPGGAL
ncbi:MAG: CoA-transferase subunit beta [Sulfobacillus sp.]